MDAIIGVLGTFYLSATLSLTHGIHPQDHRMSAGSLAVTSMLQKKKERRGVNKAVPLPSESDPLESFTAPHPVTLPCVSLTML